MTTPVPLPVLTATRADQHNKRALSDEPIHVNAVDNMTGSDDLATAAIRVGIGHRPADRIYRGEPCHWLHKYKVLTGHFTLLLSKEITGLAFGADEREAVQPNIQGNGP